MPALQFQIGGKDHEFVRVEVIESTNDGWLPSRITIRAGYFQGDFAANLDVWAFARFASELQTLYQTLNGTASFSTYESQLGLILSGDGLGHVQVKGEGMDSPGMGNKLTFHFEIDQTDVSVLLNDIAAISAAYPRVS